MFDSIHITPSRNSYSESEVHEHRAPTDESVRLLREMEAKAMENVISAMRLDSNEFKATWHIIYDGPSFSQKAICRFSLNGREERIEVCLNDLKFKEPRAIAESIRDEIAKKFASILTLQLFQEVREQRLLR